MGRNIILTAAVALALGIGGGYMLRSHAQQPSGVHRMPDGSSMSDAMADMTSMLEGKTGDAFDKAFIKEMIVHHEGAVAMAEQALAQAKHAEIKQMAQEIINAQTREIATMRDWMQSWYDSAY